MSGQLHADLMPHSPDNPQMMIVGDSTLSYNALVKESLRQQCELRIMRNLWKRLDYSLSYSELFQLLLADLYQAIPCDVVAGILDDQCMVDSPHPLDPAMIDELQRRMEATALMLGMTESSIPLGPTFSNFTHAPNGRQPILLLNSVVQIPLVVGDEQTVNGLLLIGADAENAFDEADVRFLYRIAHHAGSAVHRLHRLLHSEEKRLQNVMEVLPTGVLLLDKNQRLVTANPMGLHLIKLLDGTQIGGTIRRLNGQSLTPLLVNKVTHRLIVDSQAAQRTLELSTLRMEAGPHAGGWVLVLNDITARVQAEQAEHDHRKFATALSEISSVLNSSLDLEQVLSRIIAHVTQIIPDHPANIFLKDGDFLTAARGVGYDKYGNDDWLDNFSVHIDSSPHWRMILASSDGYIIEDTHLDSHWVQYDQTRWVRSALMMPIYQDGMVMGLFHIDSDRPNVFTATDRNRLKAFANQAGIALKNARLYEATRTQAFQLETRVFERTQELEQSTRQVEAILASSNDAIILLDNRGRMLDVNPPFERLFGCARIDALQRNIQSLLDDTYIDIFNATLQSVVQGETVAPLEVVARRSIDDLALDTDIRLALIHGDPDKIVCNLRDISSHKRAEAELQHALHKERKLVEMKNQFISVASHEFRTPMSVIRLYAELTELILKRKYFNSIPEELNRYLGKISDAIDFMALMLDEVLFIGRSDANKMPFQPQSVDIEVFSKELLSELWEDRHQTRQLETIVRGKPRPIQSDVTLLRTMLNNLLSNAIKYSPEQSKITVTLDFGDDSVHVSVKDEGVGIPFEDQERLFDTFFRASNVGNIPGSGLGLSILKRAVDAHHGSVAFVSSPNEGTTFTITLPFERFQTEAAS